MAHIFLSYSREDINAAQQLAAALERNGLSVWWDRTISPGKTFDQVIESALDESSWTIVLWSSTSIQSNWVKAESEDSLRNSKLVPVLIEDVRPPLAFRRIEAAELQNWDGNDNDQEFQQLLGVLKGKPTEASIQPIKRAIKTPQINSKDQSPSPAKTSLMVKILIGLGILFLTNFLLSIFMYEEPEPDNTTHANETGSITLQYTGDEFSCVLDLVINLDGQVIMPTSNVVVVNDVKLGAVPISVSGSIACPTLGNCSATGNGTLNARNGAKYNLIWQNTSFAQCNVTFAMQ